MSYNCANVHTFWISCLLVDAHRRKNCRLGRTTEFCVSFALFSKKNPDIFTFEGQHHLNRSLYRGLDFGKSPRKPFGGVLPKNVHVECSVPLCSDLPLVSGVLVNTLMFHIDM